MAKTATTAVQAASFYIYSLGAIIAFESFLVFQVVGIHALTGHWW